MQQIKWLWSMMDKAFHKKHILALTISVVSSVSFLIKPSLTGRLIDEVIVAQNTEPLVPILLVMLLTWLLIEGCRYMMIILLETTSQNALHNMRVRLFKKMQHQDMRFYNENRTGDLMTRMSADMDWCRHFLAGIDYITVDSIAMFVSASIYLFFVHWKLALLLMFVPAVLMLVTKVYSKRVRPLFIDMRDRLSEMNTAAQENIAGNHVVKAFAREEYEKVWNDIRTFVEFACMRDRKFYDRVKDSLLMELTDGSFVTAADYLESAKEKHENTVYYTTDKAAQAQYIAMFEAQGIKVAVFDKQLDVQFLSVIESYDDKSEIETCDLRHQPRVLHARRGGTALDG